LVTGGNGQLAQELKFLSNYYNEFKFHFTSKKELDITDFDLVEDFINSFKIEVIINCAAYTDVSKSEIEKDIANQTNNLAVKGLGLISNKYNCKFIHISTDYVFDGDLGIPYLESYKPNPKSYYGICKYEGEKSILRLNLPNSIIIRTSWLYSSFGNNFVKKIIEKIKNNTEISVVSNQIGSPTYARDLAKAILKIIPKLHNHNTEIYHYSNIAKISWFDFAVQIKFLSHKNSRINLVPNNSFDSNRPRYSVLNCQKIVEKFGVSLFDWNYSLKKCINIILKK
jgi:dTDP-4-dehydrorhamnose reductase